MQHVDSNNNSSDYEAIFHDDFIYVDSSSNIEEIMNSDSDEESKLLYLTKMGFSEAEASITMERCGSDSSIAELTDFICADQMARVTDALLMVEDRKPLCNDPNYKQRQNLGYDLWKRKKQRKLEKKLLNEDDHAIHISIPMIGSVVPTKPDQITQRTLTEDAIESLYFSYEQIHLLNSMIDQITQRTLPEDAIEHITFVPKGSVRLLKLYDDELPSSVQKYVLDECRKWNLVWVGRNKVAPLEPDEVEMLLEVVFYCLGIFLKTDVQELNDDRLEQLMSRFVEFDLVVGDIQCNNLTGRNKHHQDEIEDFCWCIFLQ
ncbi:DNA (Cytosine-5)-methyltransferase DRM1/2 isoform 2 [Hibiscus syriacus]|uniref:DNA (Cytosine-5)-methyltransferase DRM1/2 isoform 2 n=1 Tax=Hibiscus syriacus TaxID=106335 RepID=A0A6A3BBW3_HIBSY|nr:DNA (Cytosine-5)-methyltransferase DRM1/2 isoform 2 [Hibiscus syriacus]